MAKLLKLAVSALLGLGISAVAATPAAASIPSPGKYSITLEMDECGTMYLGTAGSCILSLQTWMQWAVGNHRQYVQPSGVYDEQTRQIVMKFQRRYVRGVPADGHFEDKSRAALRNWFVTRSERSKRTHGTGLPCNPSLGWGCIDDSGTVEPPAGYLAAKTVACKGLGTFPVAGVAIGVTCSFVL